MNRWFVTKNLTNFDEFHQSSSLLRTFRDVLNFFSFWWIFINLMNKFVSIHQIHQNSSIFITHGRLFEPFWRLFHNGESKGGGGFRVRGQGRVKIKFWENNSENLRQNFEKKKLKTFKATKMTLIDEALAALLPAELLRRKASSVASSSIS